MYKRQLSKETLLSEELLPYLAYWQDLNGPQERLAALEVLEANELVARVPVPEGVVIHDPMSREWIITSRLETREPEPMDPDCVLESCLQTTYLPAGLF